MRFSDQGLFVVFEGGEGAGKSTQVGMLCDWLARIGCPYVRTFEPGDSDVGKQIRAILLDPATGYLAPKAESLLYAADKAHHLQAVVRPALDRGDVVVCDRYVDSMLAYQGAGRVLDLAEVERVARWATDDLRAHLTVLLDGEPAELMRGVAQPDRMEAAGEEFHLAVRDHFRVLAARDPEHYLVLPARDSPEAIAEAVRDRVAALLPRGP